MSALPPPHNLSGRVGGSSSFPNSKNSIVVSETDWSMRLVDLLNNEAPRTSSPSQRQPEEDGPPIFSYIEPRPQGDLEEEEREKRDNYVPDISELEKPLEIDNETKDLLKLLDMANLGASGVTAGGKFGR